MGEKLEPTCDVYIPSPEKAKTESFVTFEREVRAFVVEQFKLHMDRVRALGLPLTAEEPFICGSSLLRVGFLMCVAGAQTRSLLTETTNLLFERALQDVKLGLAKQFTAVEPD